MSGQKLAGGVTVQIVRGLTVGIDNGQLGQPVFKLSLSKMAKLLVEPSAKAAADADGADNRLRTKNPKNRNW